MIADFFMWFVCMFKSHVFEETRISYYRDGKPYAVYQSKQCDRCGANGPFRRLN